MFSIEIFILIVVLAVFILVVVDRVIKKSKEKEAPQKTAPQKTDQQFGGFWVRLASITLDGILISLFSFFLLELLVKLIHSNISTENYLKFILLSFFPFLIFATYFYFAWFDCDGRVTAGKKIFGLEVVDYSFKPITLSRSLLRTLAYTFDIPGLWFILVSKKKQTLHDRFAKTYVIRAKAPRKWEKLAIFGLIALLIAQVMFFDPTKYLRNYVQTFHIPTGAMKPTILVGDFILVDKYWPKSNSPQRGDIIVFKYPEDKRLDYIFRCIAVGGQTVEIRNGDVFVDDKPEGKKTKLGRKYDPAEGRHVNRIRITTPDGKEYTIRHYVDRYRQTENSGQVTVPDGHYFVMGDNRDNSADSRSWGFLPEENVVGKAGIVYWSWDRIDKKVRWSRIGQSLP